MAKRSTKADDQETLDQAVQEKAQEETGNEKAAPEAGKVDEEKDPVLLVFEAEGWEGILKRIGLTAQAAFRSLDGMLREGPALPSEAQVFEIYDQAKKIEPVLALMGLKTSDMAPGDSPWKLRKEPQQDGSMRDKLVISLSDGCKVFWLRPVA